MKRIPRWMVCYDCGFKFPFMSAKIESLPDMTTENRLPRHDDGSHVIQCPNCGIWEEEGRDGEDEQRHRFSYSPPRAIYQIQLGTRCPGYGYRCWGFGAIRRRQNTAYVKDEMNYVTCCGECFQGIQEYWQERWDEYWSSVL